VVGSGKLNLKKGNLHGDSGLQILLSLLENESPDWLSTNEFDDFFANLRALDGLLWATSNSPALWKWVIIATHTTLQSLAVCKLTRTDGFGAMEEDVEKKIAAFYEYGKDTFHNHEEFSELAAKTNIAPFPILMRRLGYNLPNPKDSLKGVDDKLLALFYLHDFRNSYIHYPPIVLTLKASEVHRIVQISVEVIVSEIMRDDGKRRPLITIDDIEPVLDSIQRRFQEIGND